MWCWVFGVDDYRVGGKRNAVMLIVCGVYVMWVMFGEV